MWKNVMISLVIFTSGCGSVPKQSISQTSTSPTSSSTASGWTPTPTPASIPADFWGAQEQNSNPNILLVGDSITVGYTRFLYEDLIDSFSVHHSMDNNRNSYYTSLNFQKWYNEWPNDQVIVWNNGIWDISLPAWVDMYATDPKGWYTTTDDQYKANIISIAQQMLATGARVIFMTTTDVPSSGNGIWQVGRENDLNQIALSTLPSMGIEVYDLHAVALAITSMHDQPYDVHFTEEGNKILANFVEKAIHRDISPILTYSP